ncbi:class D sortase [Alicyclobacillus sp.]|uniref:class D sortase n=1 Tax=Alicyclobacillus sp. TaxID=61169 RepID=UPI0025BE1E60|nr:class D sortase [Alicyclobacillus sp.]MCL6517995.1 class D sortase [Alicyclobacillus sp.]
MVNQSGKARWWRAVMALAACLVIAGGGLLAYHGWAFLQQTVWLNRHALPQYTPVAVSGVAGKIGMGVGAERVEGAGGTAGSTGKAGANAARGLWTPAPAIGQRLGQLVIPRINLSAPVIEGTNEAQLDAGAGHDPSTALPGEGGNIFLAGHRDTVFARLRGIRVGDDILVDTVYGRFVYRVTGTRVVPASDVSVLAPTPDERLTLCTCYPFVYIGAAPDRFIVTARLVESPVAGGTQG